MARRDTTDSIEGALYLKKYENARKTDKNQEMTKFLESVSTQANPDIDDPLSQLELGYASKPQGRINDNSLSKVKNMLNTTVATTSKTKAELDPKDLTSDEDLEKSGRKLSSKMTKLKKFFSKDDKIVTTSLPVNAEDMLVVSNPPQSFLMKIANPQELPQMDQGVNNPENKMTLRVAGKYGHDGDILHESSKKAAIEEDKSDLKEKSMATHGSAKRENASTSDSLDESIDSVEDETEHDRQSPKGLSHLDPANRHERLTHGTGEQLTKPLYDDQGFLIGESENNDVHVRNSSTESQYDPKHVIFKAANIDDFERASTPDRINEPSGEEILPSLAIAHYTPSLQQIRADPELAQKQFNQAKTYVTLQQTRKLAERAREKAFAEGNQGSAPQGPLPSTPSLEELKRQEAEAGRTLEQLQREKQKGIDRWADDIDQPRQVLSGAQRQRTGFESKERKSTSTSSDSHEGQRMRYQLANPSTESRGSRKVEVLSTIAEDDLEAEYESPKPQSQSPELLHPRPLNVSHRKPSFLPQGSSRPVETSPPSTPKAQTARQLGAMEQIDLMIKHMEEARDGNVDYHEYEAPSDITVGLSPDTHMEMYPPPLHIVKKPKMKETYSSTPGYYGYPSQAFQAAQGAQARTQGPRPLPQLPQPAQPQAAGTNAWDEHLHDDGAESLLDQHAHAIITVAVAVTMGLEHILQLENAVKELEHQVKDFQETQAMIIQTLNDLIASQTGEEEVAEEDKQE
ncbi:hypothetical protein F5B19DRAFT_495512 [Rostrohypoxylon terebratum]|nr:hypothetical protein F5B19DRAFT_495512 [Rostrohypoxylon terebratum]